MNQHHQGQLSLRAAEAYEAFFVPALFAAWAPHVGDAAAIRPGDAVLDVACGTGVLSREALRRTGPGGSVVGLDRNPGMLAVAQREGPGIRWQEGVAEALPFPDGAFDAVVCQFGLMFFDDRVAALREMHRVVRPGGRLAVAVWGPLEQTPGYAAMVALLERLFGAECADELRAPYALGDPLALAALAEAAGLPGRGIATLPGEAHFPSLEAWVRTDIKAWTLADRIDDAQLERLLQEARSELARFVRPDGRVAFDSPAHVLTASRHA